MFVRYMYILLDTNVYMQIVTCAVQFTMLPTGPEKEKKCCQVRREKVQYTLNNLASKNEAFQVRWFTHWLWPTYCTLVENETYLQCLWKFHTREHLVRQNSGPQWCASTKNSSKVPWDLLPIIGLDLDQAKLIGGLLINSTARLFSQSQRESATSNLFHRDSGWRPKCSVKGWDFDASSRE